MPRTNFNSSRLVRLLSGLAGAEPAASAASFADRLGEWLDVSDAIALSAALNSGAAGLAAGGAPASAAALHGELARLRTVLAESITTDGVFRTGRVRIKLPAPAPGASPETAADFSPFHRYYVAHQRDMESNIGLLRAKLRTALAQQSPALRQLAALDVALAKALSVRERGALATVPLLLEQHFEQRRQAHLGARLDSPDADNPELWLQAGGWLALFCQDLQRVLLAELDLRLQPLVGLLEAFSNEVTKQQ